MSLRAAIKAVYRSSLRTAQQYIDTYQDEVEWAKLSQEQKTGMGSIGLIMICMVALLVYAVYDLFRVVIPNAVLIIALVLLGQWVAKKYSVPFYISIRDE